MDISELQMQLDAVVEQMEELAGGDLDDVSKRRFNQLEAEAKRLNDNINRIQKVADYKYESRRTVTKAPTPALVRDDLDYHQGTRSEGAPGNGRVTYRSLFGEPTDRGGFRDWNHFVEAFETGEVRSMLKGTPSAGGFLVPEAFAAELIGPMLEDSVALSRARIFPVERAGSIKVPGWDVSSHASTLFGGVSATWQAEGGTTSEVTASVRQVELTPRKLICMTSVTRELEQDSFAGFSAILQSSLAEAVSYYADDALIWGSGAGRPLGVMYSDALVTVAKESEQTAATVVGANLAKMWARLLPQCAKNAVWVVAPSVLSSLYVMTATGGIGEFPVFQPASGMSGAQYSTLFGRPLIVSEKMQAAGTLGDILLADWSFYAVALAQGVTVDRSESVHWTTDKSAYRVTLRLDGQPLLNTAITPKRGTDALSAFVTLAERS